MTTAITTPPTAQVMADRIVRRNEVLKMLGIGRTTLTDWQNPKSARYRPDFPKKSLWARMRLDIWRARLTLLFNA